MFRKPLYFWSILFIFLNSGVCPALGQHLTKHEWAAGEVVLTNGDKLKGAVTYYFNKEIIQVKGADSLTKTFSPVNVAYFQVFSAQKQVLQTFRPFMWSPNPEEPAFKTLAFFEVITEGKYTLIRRTAYVIRNLDPVPVYTSLGKYYEPYTPDPDQMPSELNNYQIARLNSYYLLTPESQILRLRHPKKNLEDLYQDKSGRMKAYIRKRNLSYKNPIALTHVVQYFNHL